MKVGEKLGRWLKILNVEFDGASDRSCVITACSIIDHLLGEVLKSFLVPNPTSRDPLFDGPVAPLTGFSSRIDVAFRVGLIGNRLARDLHRFREIRNDFAHSFEARELSEGAYRDKVDAIVSSLNLRKYAPTMLHAPYDSPRGRFIACTIVVLAYLETVAAESPKLSTCAVDGIENISFRESAPDKD